MNLFRFSALQRAEIAEIKGRFISSYSSLCGFSALQRAEIAEILRAEHNLEYVMICFSALQRAEIAEIQCARRGRYARRAFQCSSTSRNC